MKRTMKDDRIDACHWENEQTHTSDTLKYYDLRIFALWIEYNSNEHESGTSLVKS